MENICNLKNRKNNAVKQNEHGLREMWETIKHNNIHIMGVPEKEVRWEKTEKKIFKEMMAEHRGVQNNKPKCP